MRKLVQEGEKEGRERCTLCIFKRIRGLEERMEERKEIQKTEIEREKKDRMNE